MIKMIFKNLIDADINSPNYGKNVEIETDSDIDHDKLEAIGSAASESALRFKELFKEPDTQ